MNYKPELIAIVLIYLVLTFTFGYMLGKYVNANDTLCEATQGHY